MIEPSEKPLTSNGFTVGTPKFRRNFDPSDAEVVRMRGFSEGSIGLLNPAINLIFS